MNILFPITDLYMLCRKWSKHYHDRLWKNSNVVLYQLHVTGTKTEWSHFTCVILVKKRTLLFMIIDTRSLKPYASHSSLESLGKDDIIICFRSNCVTTYTKVIIKNIILFHQTELIAIKKWNETKSKNCGKWKQLYIEKK